ncbi:MAG: hypothetical protein VXY77_03840 [Pseudomonadota bacterium]|nr:hypothetical protein [Pseudomonadota bacterium]
MKRLSNINQETNLCKHLHECHVGLSDVRSIMAQQLAVIVGFCNSLFEHYYKNTETNIKLYDWQKDCLLEAFNRHASFEDNLIYEISSRPGTGKTIVFTMIGEVGPFIKSYFLKSQHVFTRYPIIPGSLSYNKVEVAARDDYQTYIDQGVALFLSYQDALKNDQIIRPYYIQPRSLVYQTSRVLQRYSSSFGIEAKPMLWKTHSDHRRIFGNKGVQLNGDTLISANLYPFLNIEMHEHLLAMNRQLYQVCYPYLTQLKVLVDHISTGELNVINSGLRKSARDQFHETKMELINHIKHARVDPDQEHRRVHCLNALTQAPTVIIDESDIKGQTSCGSKSLMKLWASGVAIYKASGTMKKVSADMSNLVGFPFRFEQKQDILPEAHKRFSCKIKEQVLSTNSHHLSDRTEGRSLMPRNSDPYALEDITKFWNYMTRQWLLKYLLANLKSTGEYADKNKVKLMLLNEYESYLFSCHNPDIYKEALVTQNYKKFIPKFIPSNGSKFTGYNAFYTNAMPPRKPDSITTIPWCQVMISKFFEKYGLTCPPEIITKITSYFPSRFVRNNLGEIVAVDEVRGLNIGDDDQPLSAILLPDIPPRLEESTFGQLVCRFGRESSKPLIQRVLMRAIRRLDRSQLDLELSSSIQIWKKEGRPHNYPNKYNSAIPMLLYKDLKFLIETEEETAYYRDVESITREELPAYYCIHDATGYASIDYNRCYISLYEKPECQESLNNLRELGARRRRILNHPVKDLHDHFPEDWSSGNGPVAAIGRLENAIKDQLTTLHQCVSHYLKQEQDKVASGQADQHIDTSTPKHLLPKRQSKKRKVDVTSLTDEDLLKEHVKKFKRNKPVVSDFWGRFNHLLAVVSDMDRKGNALIILSRHLTKITEALTLELEENLHDGYRNCVIGLREMTRFIYLLITQEGEDDEFKAMKSKLKNITDQGRLEYEILNHYETAKGFIQYDWHQLEDNDLDSLCFVYEGAWSWLYGLIIYHLDNNPYRYRCRLISKYLEPHTGNSNNSLLFDSSYLRFSSQDMGAASCSMGSSSGITADDNMSNSDLSSIDDKTNNIRFSLFNNDGAADTHNNTLGSSGL